MTDESPGSAGSADLAGSAESAGSAGRLAELAANLSTVRARIEAAAAAAGREPGGITLIAVTKTFPASDIALLNQLGVTNIGENRDQEAAPKAAACSAAGLEVRWHFVGQLQVNKVASVAGYADMVHSVDRDRLVPALGRRARTAGRIIECLVQVSLDEPSGGGDSSGGAGTGRGGAGAAQVSELAEALVAEEGLTLAGVMAVAPLGQPPRPAYVRLREIAEIVRSAYPAADVISAGMSDDLEEAVAEGATHVRIGTALLGGRQPFVR